MRPDFTSTRPTFAVRHCAQPTRHPCVSKAAGATVVADGPSVLFKFCLGLGWDATVREALWNLRLDPRQKVAVAES